ncbi:MAG: hypothetical protein ACODAU_11410 [Myxococcota bacterium]
MHLIRLSASTVFLFAVACGSNGYDVRGMGQFAGADATLEVETLEGGNALIRLRAKHLPPPERLEPNLRTYVMWFVPEDDPASKAAVLSYDAEARKGDAMATTVRDMLTVRVTAEESAEVTSPGTHTVFEQRVQIER